MRSCLAVFIFIFLFFPVTLCALTITAINSWLLNRDFYIETLAQPSIYDAIINDGLRNNAEFTLENGQVRGDSDVISSALADAISVATTPEYLRDQVVKNVNALFDFFDDISNGLKLEFDLKPVKTALADPEKQAAFATAYAQLMPPCDGEAAFSNGLPTCHPAELTDDQFVAGIKEGLPGFAQSLPDIVPITPPELSNQLVGVGSVRAVVNTGQISLLILAAISWLSVGFLGGQSPREAWLIMGFSLLIPAVMVVLMGIATGPDLMRSTLSTSLTFAEGGVNVEATLNEVVAQAASRISGGFITSGFIAIAVACVALIIGLLSPRTRQKRKNESLV
ncbi:MAG: hypothetical protein OHK0023_00940 [Anaerolineae bacterium]